MGNIEEIVKNGYYEGLPNRRTFTPGKFTVKELFEIKSFLRKYANADHKKLTGDCKFL